MSKDRNIDDAELAKISGAGDNQALSEADDSGGTGKDELREAQTGTGGSGSTGEPDTDDTGGGNQNLGG